MYCQIHVVRSRHIILFGIQAQRNLKQILITMIAEMPCSIGSQTGATRHNHDATFCDKQIPCVAHENIIHFNCETLAQRGGEVGPTSATLAQLRSHVG